MTPAHARDSDPLTSHEAAAGIDKRYSHDLVAEAFRVYGPATDEQLITRVGMLCEVRRCVMPSESRIRGARGELKAVEVGRGKTERGGNCTVWDLT